MQIIIKTVSGRKRDFNLDDNLTVADLKKSLTEKEGISPDQFRLIVKGKVMADDKTLKSYQLTSGTVINMLLCCLFVLRDILHTTKANTLKNIEYSQGVLNVIERTVQQSRNHRLASNYPPNSRFNDKPTDDLDDLTKQDMKKLKSPEKLRQGADTSHKVTDLKNLGHISEKKETTDSSQRSATNIHDHQPSMTSFISTQEDSFSQPFNYTSSRLSRNELCAADLIGEASMEPMDRSIIFDDRNNLSCVRDTSVIPDDQMDEVTMVEENDKSMIYVTLKRGTTDDNSYDELLMNKH